MIYIHKHFNRFVCCWKLHFYTDIPSDNIKCDRFMCDSKWHVTVIITCGVLWLVITMFHNATMVSCSWLQCFTMPQCSLTFFNNVWQCHKVIWLQVTMLIMFSGFWLQCSTVTDLWLHAWSDTMHFVWQCHSVLYFRLQCHNVLYVWLQCFTMPQCSVTFGYNVSQCCHVIWLLIMMFYSVIMFFDLWTRTFSFTLILTEHL